MLVTRNPPGVAKLTSARKCWLKVCQAALAEGRRGICKDHVFNHIEATLWAEHNGYMATISSQTLSVQTLATWLRGSLATLPIGHLRPYPPKPHNTVTCDPTSFYCAGHTKLDLVTCDPTHPY